MTTLASVLLAPDPAVPLRDALFDPQRAPVPIEASSDGVVAAVASVGIQPAGASVYYVAERLARPSLATID